MALNTFADLSTGLQSWLEDDDAEFVGDIDDVIDLAEKRLLRDLDLAIFRRTDSSATMTVSQATVTKPIIALPDLLISTKTIWLTGGALTGATPVEQRSMELIIDYNNGVVDGVPKYFAEEDETTWIFGPTPDATYAVNARYLSRPPRLETTNQTNWLSDNVYDILFKACLAEAEKFLKADERAAVWDSDYIKTMPQVRRELYQQYGNQYDRLGMTPVPAAPRSLTP